MNKNSFLSRIATPARLIRLACLTCAFSLPAANYFIAGNIKYSDLIDRALVVGSADGTPFSGVLEIPEEVEFDRYGTWETRKVTGIDMLGIANATELYEIKIPTSVWRLYSSAVSNCTPLPAIHLPASITTLGNSSPFPDCSELMEITVDKENKKFCSVDGMLMDINREILYCCPGGKPRVNIPETTKKIFSMAFSGCKRLEEIDLPEGITTFENYAFSDCQSVKKMRLPSSATQLGNACFSNNFYLRDFSCGDNLATIAFQSFWNCIRLENVELGSGITAIYRNAFSTCSRIRTLRLHSIEPPTFKGTATNEGFPDDVYAQAILIVPDGTKSSYMEADVWKNFQNILEEKETLANDVLLEYYIDKDPGIGKGIEIKAEFGLNTISLPSESLTEGFHLMGIRAIDGAGGCSTTITRPIFIEKPTEIIALEYFLDDDPGDGNGTPVAIPNPEENISFTIDSKNLPLGQHSLTIKAQTPDGRWQETSKSNFLVTMISGVANIAMKGDFEFERSSEGVTISVTDPADEIADVEVLSISGITIAKSAGSSASHAITIPVDPDIHPLIVRVKTASGLTTIKKIL